MQEENLDLVGRQARCILGKSAINSKPFQSCPIPLLSKLSNVKDRKVSRCILTWKLTSDKHWAPKCIEMPLVWKFITFYLQLTKLHFLSKATKPSLRVQSHKAEYFFLFELKDPRGGPPRNEIAALWIFLFQCG